MVVFMCVCLLNKQVGSSSCVYRLTSSVMIDVSGPVCPTYSSLTITSHLFFHFNLFPLCCVQIMKEIQEHKIKIYEFPDTDDEEEMKIVRKIKVCKETVWYLVALNCF